MNNVYLRLTNYNMDEDFIVEIPDNVRIEQWAGEVRGKLFDAGLLDDCVIDVQGLWELDEAIDYMKSVDDNDEWESE